MKITDAKFTRRFKIAEYEWEEYTLAAAIEENETAQEVLGQLKEEVNAAFTGEVKEEEKPAKKGKKNGTGKQKRDDTSDDSDETDTEANASSNDESNDDDEATDDSSSDDDSSSSSGDEGESEETEESSGKSSGKSKGGKKEDDDKGKKFRKKPQSYNRSLEQHKEIFSGVLKSVAPDWKKTDASKAKAKDVSQKMEGKEFLDDNGEVLDSFKAEVKKLMGKK